MRLSLSCFVASAVLATLALTAVAQSSSVEKARDAIRVLQSSAPSAEKAMACKDLGIYGSVDAVPALAPLLTDSQLSSWARIALEAIPGAAADAALREALDKVQGRLLVGVINSIGVRRDAKAVSPLTAKLKDADADVASAAAITLGKIGGDKAARTLEPLLTKAPGTTRSAVAQGCILCAEQYVAAKKHSKAVKLYDAVRKADLPQQRVLEATRGAILARQAKGIPLLLETLRSPDRAMFGMGLSVARELPGRSVTDALVAELDKTSPNRQGPLLLALADRNDKAVLPVVLASARAGAKSLRLVAIEAIGQLGAAAGGPVLLDAAVEADTEIAQAAKTSLASLPAREVDAELCARLPRTSGKTRCDLIQLAGQRQVSAAVPLLIKASSDPDPAIRAAAIKALGETVSVADLGALTDLLVNARTDDDRDVVEAALESACSRIPEKPTCADKLLAAFASGAPPAKCAILRVLVTVNTPKTLAAVQTATKNPDTAIRDAAVRTLADWPEPAALPSLLEVYRSTGDDTHRFLALRGCVRLLGHEGQQADQALKVYAELLSRTQRTDDRKVLLSGLANVADAAALQLAEPLLADDQVLAEAELAVLKIAGAITKSAPAEARAAANRLRAESKNATTRDRATKILRELDKRG